MSFKTKFSNLGHPNRIWTVSAIHGETGRLKAVHESVYAKFQPGDRLVYTGNYFCGLTGFALDTMEELLAFRRALLARSGVMADDFVYLRGIQEELWNKLLQIQFAQSPREVLEWMETRYPEMDGLLALYGSNLAEGRRIAREGVLSLTKWSSALRNRMREYKGHEKFFTVIRRAAFTENGQDNDNNLLFVHAGFDPSLPLMSQGDHLWWASKGFNQRETPYKPFRTVIRGHDPDNKGIHVGAATISLDGGCGYGGQLVCAHLSNAGQVLELIDA